MRILDELSACKGQFGSEAACRTEALLERLVPAIFREPADLIHLHETALFLRAFPPSPRVAELAEQLLHVFADRMCGIDPAPFDDPAVSGIAGTAVSTNFSYEFASSLTARHARSVTIDWENYARPDRLGGVLGRLIPLAYEDYAVERHVDWRAWLDREARGPDRGGARWLIDRVDPTTYDLLEVPLRWELGRSLASRSTLRLKRGKHFIHSAPFLKRSDVSIEAELSEPPISIRRLSRRQAGAVLGVIIDASATRYRELYGFQHPDENYVDHADLGRGVDLYFFGVPKERRLPLRAYHSGMFFKNGVPMGYVETLSLFERCEIGFNLYYTFRDGETAWLYARILKLLHQQLGVACFSIDPYQLGHENEEAIASGAFWFYYKLGFRPAAQEVAKLAEREAAKAASRPGHRTPPAILRKLAAAHLFYGADGSAWGGFSLHRPGGKVPDLGEDIARTKRAAEETCYLRLLQRRPDLRARMLRR
ncbi:MAG TPA: hypothetical protein VGG72_35610 [Bryobacteraceae bacterium]|jgi:hypothetical protein